jgi:MerR family transcriptional regulator, mercuric resistance operon regulatory protein
MNTPLLTIGRLASTAGVGVETIRYYQRRGLLPTPDCGGGVRRYGQAELDRLRFIRHAQHLGFSLEEAGELLGLDEMQDRAVARALARGKLVEIEGKIHRLEAVRAALQDLVGCCEQAPGADPCPILHTLAAGQEGPLTA